MQGIGACPEAPSKSCASSLSGLQLPVPACSRARGNPSDLASSRAALRVGRKNVAFKTRHRFRPRAQLNRESQGSDAWNHKLRLALSKGTSRYYERLQQDLRSEAGLDVQQLKEILTSWYEFLSERRAQFLAVALPKTEEVQPILRNEDGGLVAYIRFKLWPQFVAWHQWGRWKQWDAQHIGAFILYVLLAFGSCRALYTAATIQRLSEKEVRKLSELYVQATASESTTENANKLQRQFLQVLLPRRERHLIGPDGVYHHDFGFSGENFGEGIQQLPEDYIGILRESFLANFQKEMRVQNPYGTGFGVARRWWKYRPKLPYLDCIRKLKNREVRSVVFSEDLNRLFLLMKEGFPSELIVDVPADPYLFRAIDKSGAEIDFAPQSMISNALRACVIIAPTVLILMLLNNWQYVKRKENKQQKYDRSIKCPTLVTPMRAVQAGFPTFNDVVVDLEVWSAVEQIANFLTDPMLWYSKQQLFYRGVLLYGPPGTGKTHIARAMARELRVPFIYASGSDFDDSSEKISGSEKVSNLFLAARANAPSIVFIDEIDALAGQHVAEDGKRQKTFKRLLMELDGKPEDFGYDRFSRRQAFILICATNRPEDLHEDCFKTGRIDRKLHIRLPKEEERSKIFNVHSGIHQLADDVDFRKVVYRTKGFSGADVKSFVDDIALNAKQNGRSTIHQSDILDVLEKQLFEKKGITVSDEEQREMEMKVTPEKKRLLAVHEAGHVLLAHLFPHFDWHALTHLLPGGKESPLSVFYPSEERYDCGGGIGYYMAQMVVAHGGRGAERLLLGDDVTDGWRDDLCKISELARECAICIENRRLGPLKVARLPNSVGNPNFVQQELHPKTWNHPESSIIKMEPPVSEFVAREIQRFIDDTEKMAMDGLRKNRHILEKLALELERRIKMSGDEARDIVLSMKPVMLEDIAKPEPKKLLTLHDLQHYEDLDVYPAPLHRC